MGIAVLAVAAAAPPAPAKDGVRVRAKSSPTVASRGVPGRQEPASPPEFRPGTVTAASAILVEGSTGEILYAHAPRERRAPASLTKVMTAVVILERVRLSDPVVVSPRAPEAGGHAMGLRAGQRLSVRDLLAALLIRSANDAAVALAEHAGGSVAGFAELMNAKAKDLGMGDSSFRNPHGLDAPDHYSTAYDLVLLTRYALQSQTFAELVRARQVTIALQNPGVRQKRRPGVVHRVVRSHNRLLSGFEGADGVKTGFTNEAGRCLVASAQRGDRRLIAVLLNDPRRWENAASLLEYGFTRLGVPAAIRASSPGGLTPPPHLVPEDPQVGG